MKADAELDKSRTSIDEDADVVVKVARDRAQATLEVARERADQVMTDARTAPTHRKKIEGARAEEDEAVAAEQATADDQLRIERSERHHTLSELLRLERAATDEDLVVERARADEVVATRDDFLGMASHDMRSILSGIALSAGLLAKHAAPAGEDGLVVLRHAERIQRFTARLNLLVADLLDVVSLEAGQLLVAPQANDAVKLVREAVDAFEASFVAKGVALSAEIASPSALATFDHDRALQVLANLLGNALKFTEPGGRVVVSLALTGADVRFSVVDTGVGIPADHALIVFERFRQVIAKDRRGLGLGLYIAKCIVLAHGGNIWVERPDGGGAALHFTLPLGGAPGSPH